MKIKLRFAKQSANFFAFEPVDKEIGVGLLYLRKRLFDRRPPNEIEIDVPQAKDDEDGDVQI